MVAVSPSMRTHSCSFVYRKFSGYMTLFRSFVERSFDRDRIHGLVADHDLDALAGLRVLNRQIAETDVLIKGGGGRAARDPTRGSAVEVHFVPVAANAAPAHFKTHHLAFEAALLLF